MTGDERAAIEDRLRRICLALPGTTERPSHGAAGFFAPKAFVAIRMLGHHQREFPQLWFAAPPGVQAELVDDEPDRFFVPPYVGGRGWVGLRLDGELDWDELAAICADAHRSVT